MVLPQHIQLDLSKQQAKQYRRLWTSRNDLEKANSYAEHIIKKRLHSGHIRSKGAYLQSDAFTTSLIISYARAFIDPSDWEDKLLSLSRPTDEQLKLHKTLISMRNELFAHSDLRHYGITPGRYGSRRTETVDTTHFELTANEVRLLDQHIETLCLEIHRKMIGIVDACAAKPTNR